MKHIFLSLAFFFICHCFLFITPSHANSGKQYIGSNKCESCHEHEYKQFTTYSKKSHSRKNVEKMLPKLNKKEQEECYACHTTGFGTPSGFKSYEQTPELGDVGCETCHGPGSEHAETGDTSAITRKPAMETCIVCHNAERINNFNFSPLMYSGAH